MTEKQKQDIYFWIDITIAPVFPDAFDRDLVVISIFDEVIKDIEQTADDNFNGGDIDMAIARVLKARILK